MKISYKDLQKILDNAKLEYRNLPAPLYVSKEAVQPSQVPHIAVLESFIGFLNKNALLSQNVTIDYRQGVYDDNEDPV